MPMLFLASFLALANVQLQQIPGREAQAIYQVKAEENWRFNPNTDLVLLQDTTKPLAEFFILDPSGDIRITIHNFPSQSLEDRISPEAQLKRWERQFQTQDPVHQRTTPQSFSGFKGLLYEGKGTIDGKEMSMMAWAMQMGDNHYRILSKPCFSNDRRSCITLKALGPASAMKRHRDEIFEFARSFELIEEIPAE